MLESSLSGLCCDSVHQSGWICGILNNLSYALGVSRSLLGRRGRFVYDAAWPEETGVSCSSGNTQFYSSVR